MQLSQRIKELRSEKGWTQGDLAKFSGVSLGTIKRYELDTTNPTQVNLEKITNALGVKIKNLYDENLSLSVSLSQDDKMSLSVPKSPNLSDNMSTNLPNLKKSQVKQIEQDQIFIRELSSKVGAGESVDIDGIEIYDTEVLVPFSKILFKLAPNVDKLRCMRVDGYSMIPMLYPDSWVIADVTTKFSGDGLYIVNYSGNFMVKLLQKAPNGTLYIKSANKEYESYEIGPDDQTEAYIVGKVLRCVI